MDAPGDADFRKFLLSSQQAMQSEYDKSILALSGGALGVSMAFLKDIILQQGQTVRTVVGGGFLMSAWLCWGASVTCTLVSFYASTQAFGRAIQQADSGAIYSEAVGGRFNTLTKWLNLAAGLLFMVGVISIVLFVHANLF